MKKLGLLLLAACSTDPTGGPQPAPASPAEVEAVRPATPPPEPPRPTESSKETASYPVQLFAPLAGLERRNDPFDDVFQVRVRPDAPPSTVASCDDLLALPLTADVGLEPETERDIQVFWSHAADCLAARLLNDAQPARRSLIEGVLAAEDPSKLLPPLLGLSDFFDRRTRVEAAAKRCKSWKAYDNTLRLKKLVGDRFDLHTEVWSGTLLLYARADFDGDGFEDLLVQRLGWAEGGGSFAAVATFLLSRTDSDPCIRVARELGRS